MPAASWPPWASRPGRRPRRAAPGHRWLLADSQTDPNNSLAGATPYLRMFRIVTGGWLLARSAAAAQRALDEGGDSDACARSWSRPLLRRAGPAPGGGLVPSVTAGPSDLLAAAF